MNDHLYSTEDLERMNASMKNMEDKLKRTHTVALPPKVTPERMHNTSGFPDEPISPASLASQVIEKLNSFPNVVAPINTSTMVEELCRSFNECIRLNNAGESQTLVLSPKTGSAKSVSSQMYIALLQSQASIVVVYTIEDAIETCKNINEWSGNKNYARCTYKVGSDNKDHHLRVDKDQLSQYRCIVISHALFKLANDVIGIELLSTYEGKKREFVLVDERMDFYKEITFPLSNITLLLKLYNDIKQFLAPALVDNEIKYLETTRKIFEEIQEITELKMKIVAGKPVPNYELRNFMYFDEDQRIAHDLQTYDFSNFYKLLEDRIVKLEKVIDPLSLLDSKVDTKKIINNLKKHLNNLVKILKNDFYYFARGSDNNAPTIMVTRNILNELGSSVVLDATATVNELYNNKVLENPDTVKHIETTNPRKYNNFTINECRGVQQGKNSVFNCLTPAKLETIVGLYKNIAYSLIENKHDKLLIVAHQDFRKHLETKLKKEAIEFTHWGDHRGKNKWSQCNKILVIGWNYLPDKVHYLNYISAINGTQDINNQQLRDIKDSYSITQITDDLVQAVNRGAVRNTASIDGNCVESQVYMFYPNTKDGNTVMELFKKEFEGAIENSWTPVGIEKIQSLAKNYANIERVADYIERKINEVGEIKQAVVQSYFDDKTNAERLSLNEERMAKTTVNNAIKHKEFTHLLQSKGIHRVPHNGKSYKFEKINKTST